MKKPRQSNLSGVFRVTIHKLVSAGHMIISIAIGVLYIAPIIRDCGDADNTHVGCVEGEQIRCEWAVAASKIARKTRRDCATTDRV